MNEFIRMMKSIKQVYCECPNCKVSFSLYGAKLFSGKTPPKYALTNTIGKLQGTIDNLTNHLIAADYDNVQMEKECDTTIADIERRLNTSKLTLKSIKENEYLRNKLVIDEKTKLSVASSRNYVKGRIAEMYPDFNSIGINPLDVCVPTPKPVDFIAFNGYYDRHITDIVFCDSKANSRKISTPQRAIRNAINNGRVSFKILSTDVSLE